MQPLQVQLSDRPLWSSGSRTDPHHPSFRAPDTPEDHSCTRDSDFAIACKQPGTHRYIPSSPGSHPSTRASKKAARTLIPDQPTPHVGDYVRLTWALGRKRQRIERVMCPRLPQNRRGVEARRSGTRTLAHAERKGQEKRGGETWSRIKDKTSHYLTPSYLELWIYTGLRDISTL